MRCIFSFRHDDAAYIRLAHQDFSSRYVREISVSLSAGTIIVMAARISSASTGGGTPTAGGAKTVLWGCSVEPSLLQDPAIAEDVRDMSLITARESITYQGLLEAGIRENVVSALTRPSNWTGWTFLCRRALRRGNTVGINVSPPCRGLQGGDLVVENYAALVALILNETGMQVALIPHVEKKRK